MSLVLDNLNSVLMNVQSQAKTMEVARAQAEIVGRTVSPEVQAAIDVLIKAFPENPVQVIGRLIGAQLQLVSLDKTQIEVNVLVAGLQTLIAKEELLSEVGTQMEVNAQPQAPLSNAAGSSEFPAANDENQKATTAKTTFEASAGNQIAPDQKVNGVIA